MNLIWGALIGAAATVAFSLIRDWVQRRWRREDVVREAFQVKIERADQRSEEAAGLIADLADSLLDQIAIQDTDEPKIDEQLGYYWEDLVSPVAREIRKHAIRLTNNEARTRIETATYIAGSSSMILNHLGGQKGHFGWKVAREIREVAGAVLRNEPMPSSLIDDYVGIWEVIES
jgi:hypothetical protein